MSPGFTKFGVCFLGITAWAALSDAPSVPSLVIGCLSVAVLAYWFILRIRQEINAIREDDRRARERREARKRGRQVGD
ncbi:hypothetical protein ABZ690_17805 [Streptomyces sp. NPDC006967]|uniref:hypothetical protein n=1 Tax=unclassified Streptomyces TaxID=2593676 RepID=UPI000CD54912|nr:hypothetical protein [Streptomyces sp. SM1]